MMDIGHILVVDDDRRIRELLQSYLKEQGYLVSIAASAAEAREKMRGLLFDLIVLDIMMPGETGLELTAALRAEAATIPILLLSALAQPGDRIAGLATGSDDYLAKPFEPQELLLRIQNLLRRAIPRDTVTDVAFGDCQFNIQRGDLSRRGVAVHLTSREKDLLRLLVRRAGQALNRQELAQPHMADSVRGVDVQINRLRQKIEVDPANPVFLQTVRGAGYALYLNVVAR
jgi:two-component system, OmpR family, phosphate regulon response regulator OmpR